MPRFQKDSDGSLLSANPDNYFTETPPKILTFDIETTPIIAYSWGPKWEANLIEVIEESKILSFSAKWLGGEHVTKGWINYKGYRNGLKDDRAIVKDIWELLDKSDIIITQNGIDFDLRTVNSRFIYHGLNPPSPYKVIDTKREAKKYLRLPSNSLDDIGAYFGLGRKQEHEGFPLWKKCMEGDRKAWKKMLSYNRNDVLLTEKLYLKLRPWLKTHPNISSLVFDQTCPKCGSASLQSRGYHRTHVALYHSYQCQKCGGWSRSVAQGGQKASMVNTQ